MIPSFSRISQNADFEHGTAGWDVHAAEAGSIQPKSFPRYGHIEMRFMGQNRPPDPEHIGDTFLWMKRSPKGPNTFSQTIKNLEPGRLYSFEMLSCDYQDLRTSQTENAGAGEQIRRNRDARGRRDRPEAIVPRNVSHRARVSHADADLDHLPLDDLPSERPDGETHRFRLALKKRAAGNLRPGADLQLPGTAAVSRVTASIARIGSSDRLKGLSTSPRISSVTAPSRGSSPGSPRMTGVWPSP